MPLHTNTKQTTEAAAKYNGAELVITGKWAFDIIYEFVYQFQEACQYRASAVSLLWMRVCVDGSV